ncbi:hypothetical protein KAT95_03045 [Candidatus Parcubacteria bacterium]|nr:hypothetical protein [Candidatus Parcubacteria bacterium]
MAKSSTQDFLQIEQIREGVIILKNKLLRGVLMVSSLNFALKSDDEQSAIIYQFQNFLNSLDFSCQILVQSRRINITGYIDKLKKLEKEQTDELLQIQTSGYREFIESLVKAGTIMNKNFFIIVPFSLSETKQNEKKGIFKAPKIPKLTEEEFQRSKIQLQQRMEFIILGLRRCGLKAIPLTTPEIIELFWGLHHPNQAEVGYYPEIPPELQK